MKVYAMTDVGKIRPINEDSFWLPKAGERFCAVADGMGGHNAGEVASAMAVESFAAFMRASERTGGAAIHAAVAKANADVYAAALNDVRKSGMGTTFTALAEEDTRVHIAHVGDSRAYLIRDNSILRVTTDHTLVEEMVQKGLITAKEARVHPKKNYITRALGAGERVEIDLIQLDKRPDDVYLLCSDGLSNHLDEKTILAITLSKESWEEKLARLVQIALEAGGPDNITAMYATFEEVHA